MFRLESEKKSLRRRGKALWGQREKGGWGSGIERGHLIIDLVDETDRLSEEKLL